VNCQLYKRASKKHGQTYSVRISFEDPRTERTISKRFATGESDRAAAQAKAKELAKSFAAKVLANEIRHSDKQPINELLLEDFLGSRELAGRSDATIKDYRRYFNRFLWHIDPKTPLCNITSTQIRGFLSSISSAYSRRGAYRALYAAFNFAMKEDKIEQHPMRNIEKPTVSEKEPAWVEESTFSRTWEMLPEGSYKDRVAKYAALLAFETGMRSGELRYLRMRDIQYTQNCIKIACTNEHRTKSRKERFVAITERVLEAVRLQQRNKLLDQPESVRESEYLFPNRVGGPYDVSEFGRMFCRVRRMVLPDEPGLHLHSMRHSFAQNAYNTGTVPIQELTNYLGHSTPAVTMRYARASSYSRQTNILNYLQSKSRITRPGIERGHMAAEVAEHA
jgi:integrase